MRYLLRPINNSPVYIAMIYNAGGIYQPANKFGISHLTEHILIAGCEKSKYNICAQTQYKSMSFFAQILNPDRHKIKDALNEMYDVIKDPNLTDSNLKHEINAIKNELANFGYDYPNTNKIVLHDNLFSNLSPIKDYEIIGGYIRDPARNISLNDVKEYIAHRLKCPNQIIITGDFNELDAKNWINNKLNSCIKETKPKITRKSLPKKTTIIFDESKNLDIDEVYYGVGWAIKCENKKEIIALIIAFKALANINNGLYKLLRYKHDLIYHFSMDHSYANSQLNLSLHTSYLEKNQDRVTDIIMSFISDKTTMVSTIKTQLEFEYNTSLSLSDGSKQTYSSEFFFSQFKLSINDYLKHLNILSGEEIASIFMRYISSGNATILIS